MPLEGVAGRKDHGLRALRGPPSGGMDMSATKTGAASACADFDADVAIVGGGPVGTFLAILLGRQGKRVTLIERWTQSYGRPRAATYDHEIVRLPAVLGVDFENGPAASFHH